MRSTCASSVQGDAPPASCVQRGKSPKPSAKTCPSCVHNKLPCQTYVRAPSRSRPRPRRGRRVVQDEPRQLDGDETNGAAAIVDGVKDAVEWILEQESIQQEADGVGGQKRKRQ